MVIVLATLKGGSGKTTLTACLAAYWQAHGRNPVLVDADPERSLTAWYHSGHGLCALELHTEAGERASTLIRRFQPSHPLMIVDTPGFRNPGTVALLATADLTLIPVKPSAMDVRAALETNRLLQGINASPERQLRPVLARFVLSMTTPGSVIARHIRSQMLQAGLPLLHAEVGNRVGFGESMLRGGTPNLVAPGSPAARDIAALATEVDQLLLLGQPSGEEARQPQFQPEKSPDGTQETTRPEGA